MRYRPEQDQSVAEKSEILLRIGQQEGIPARQRPVEARPGCRGRIGDPPTCWPDRRDSGATAPRGGTARMSRENRGVSYVLAGQKGFRRDSAPWRHGQDVAGESGILLRTGRTEGIPARRRPVKARPGCRGEIGDPHTYWPTGRDFGATAPRGGTARMSRENRGFSYVLANMKGFRRDSAPWRHGQDVAGESGILLRIGQHEGISARQRPVEARPGCRGEIGDSPTYWPTGRDFGATSPRGGTARMSRGNRGFSYVLANRKGFRRDIAPWRHGQDVAGESGILLRIGRTEGIPARQRPAKARPECRGRIGDPLTYWPTGRDFGATAPREGTARMSRENRGFSYVLANRKGFWHDSAPWRHGQDVAGESGILLRIGQHEGISARQRPVMARPGCRGEIGDSPTYWPIGRDFGATAPRDGSARMSRENREFSYILANRKGFRRDSVP
jgi:hypothetical protein